MSEMLITAMCAGYTEDDCRVLGTSIITTLLEIGVCPESLEEGKALADIAASFVAPQEMWDEGKKDLEKFGTFIAIQMLKRFAKFDEKAS